MRQRLLWAMMVLLVPASLRADPIAIVDTGSGPSEAPGFHLGGLQWVAVEFPVTTPAVITAVQGWMWVTRAGTLDLALYRDGGEIPGEALYRITGRIESGTADWRGLSSLTWPVATGTYWIGFEVPGPDSMSGALPYPSARPLENGAVVDRESDGWYQEADAVAQMGLRVFAEADPAPVPEPASILLLATGLGGLVARRQRSRRNDADTRAS